MNLQNIHKLKNKKLQIAKFYKKKCEKTSEKLKYFEKF